MSASHSGERRTRLLRLKMRGGTRQQVVIIDVRRHAERASGPAAEGDLSAAGLAMARRLRSPGDGFALVISSPRQRARDTAIVIADRVDEIDQVLGGSPDEVLTQAQYDTLRSQEAVAELLRTSAPTHRFAEEQLAFWQRVAGRVTDGERALLVTHGGNVELPAVLLATRLGVSVGPLPLTYCQGVRIRFERGAAIALERLLGD